jgi:hypothetical protein
MPRNALLSCPDLRLADRTDPVNEVPNAPRFTSRLRQPRPGFELDRERLHCRPSRGIEACRLLENALQASGPRMGAVSAKKRGFHIDTQLSRGRVVLSRREQLAAGIGHTLQPGDRNEGRTVLWTDLDRAGVTHMIEVGVEYGAR